MLPCYGRRAEMTLYINCCLREESRTDRLAREVIRMIGDDDVQELDLYSEVRSGNLKSLSKETLAKRDRLSAAGDFSDHMFDYARQFMAADHIVVGAPFWDYSFPSVLKTYIENVFCVGLITIYDQAGVPHGQCRSDRLYYVSTSGGPFISQFGYEWLRAVVTRSFGIPETELIYAENLDIAGDDPQEIMDRAISALR